MEASSTSPFFHIPNPICQEIGLALSSNSIQRWPPLTLSRASFLAWASGISLGLLQDPPDPSLFFHCCLPYSLFSRQPLHHCDHSTVWSCQVMFIFCTEPPKLHSALNGSLSPHMACWPSLFGTGNLPLRTSRTRLYSELALITQTTGASLLLVGTHQACSHLGPLHWLFALPTWLIPLPPQNLCPVSSSQWSSSDHPSPSSPEFSYPVLFLFFITLITT